MDTRRLISGVLIGVLGLAGCGEEAPSAPPAPPVSVPAGPTIPQHGIAYLEPTRQAKRLGARVAFDGLAEAQAWLEQAEGAQRYKIEGEAELKQADRLRFWLLPEEGLEEAAADAEVEAVWQALSQAVDAAFLRALEAAAAVNVQAYEEGSARVAAAQEALRGYLESRRGLPATSETRREQARLEHVLGGLVEELEGLSVWRDELREAIDAKPSALRRVR